MTVFRNFFFGYLILWGFSPAAFALEVSLTNLSPAQKDFARFYWQGLLPPEGQGWSEAADRLTFDCQALEEGTCQMMADTSPSPSVTMDFSAMQTVWMEHYLATRTAREHTFLTDTHRDFLARTDYRSWPSEVIAFSRIKQAKRVIFRGTVNNLRVSVAETWEEGEAREIEIAIERKQSPHSYEFYVYDIDGQIAMQSAFPAGVRPAPKICVGCHLDRRTGKTSRFFPE